MHYMKCAWYLTLDADIQSYVKKKIRGKRVQLFTNPLSLKNIHNDTEILIVFVDSIVNKHIIDAMPKLQCIITCSTGYDHIDLQRANQKGITVMNVPSYGEHTVAEYTFGLLLTLTRHIHTSIQRVKEGNFHCQGLVGTDLYKKKIGIIGTGKIGSQFAHMCAGFGTTIQAYDPYPNKELIKRLPLSYMPLSSLLKTSDIISLHLPLTKKTHHMIDKKQIKQMKKGVIIINTARGSLINSEALLWGLEKHIIKWAALDVLEGEDMMEDRYKVISQHMPQDQIRTNLMNTLLINHPNVIVTPHNAFNSQEAIERIIDTSIENITAYIKKKPINIIHNTSL